MNVRWLAAEVFEGGDAELPKVKRAAPAGRRLVALARRIPGLVPEVTGLYQALGAEKALIARPLHEQLAAEGFDAAGTTTPLFHFTPYGPVASLALELKCRGPFVTLEGSGDEGLLALGQALTDLTLQRCRFALVCAWHPNGEARLLALAADPAGLCWASAHGRTRAEVQARLSARAGQTLTEVAPAAGQAQLGSLGEGLRRASTGEAVSVLVGAGGGTRASGLALWPGREEGR